MNAVIETEERTGGAASQQSAASAGRHILLLGTHGQANIGDELLLETFLDQLGSHHRYTVNSYTPDATRAGLSDRYDVEVLDTASTRIGLLRHIRRSDVVVFGGGSVVKELYASVGRWRHATLVMVLAVVLAARALRRPVLLCGIGVGPLPTRTGRFLAGVIVRSASLVSVRDAGSYEMCRRLGLDGDRLVRIPDVVFVNGRDRFVCGDAPTPPRRGHDRLRIALNLNRDIANGERWDDFLDELAEALDLVAERTPIEVHALPMQSQFKQDDDLTVLRSFLAGHPDWHPIVHAPDDHIEVAAIVDACDVVVSERLHAIVISAVLGRPVVGLVYDVKVAELVDQLGIADRSVDVNASVDPARLADVIIHTAARGGQEGVRLGATACGLRRSLDLHFSQVRRWLAEPADVTWATSDALVAR